MAKFTTKNIEFKDGQKAIFGSEDDSSIYWDETNAQLTITTVVSGVDPVEAGHLVTKRYVDVATVPSGVGRAGQYIIPDATEYFTVDLVEPLDTIDYYVVGNLENTIDAEPAKYGFVIAATTLSGFDVQMSDITDSANYLFNYTAVYGEIKSSIGVSVPGPQGIQGIQGLPGEQGIQGETGASGISAPTDHGLLTGLGDDDHPQYLLETEFTSSSGVLQVDIDTKISDVSEDTTPQLGGDLELNEHNIVLDPAPTVNQTANGIIIPMQVDVNTQGFGAPLYMASDGNLEMADATSSATMPCVAMALEAGTGVKNCLLSGVVRNDSWNWTLGGVDGLIYGSTTAGGLTQTLVSGTGQQVQVVGYAIHADRMFFNPQLPMVEIV